MQNSQAKLTILLSVFAATLFVITPLVRAQVATTPPGAAGANRLREQASEALQNRCELTNQKIDLIVDRFEANKERHVTRYNETKTKIQNLVTKADEKGYDVATLTEDLKKLDVMVQDFAQAYANFIATLQATKELDCGNSDGGFAAKVRESRTQLVEVRSQAVAIRDFFITTIRVDIQELKAQKPVVTESASVSTDANGAN